MTYPTGPGHPSHVDRFAHGHGHPGWVETLHGTKDFLGRVEEEYEVEHPGVGTLPDDVQKGLPQPRHAVSVDAFLQPAEGWTSASYTLGQPVIIAHRREDRLRIIVTNWGPGICYLSNDTSGNASGAVQVAVNGSREFRTKGQIYAFGSGTVPVIDVQDEFGVL